MSVPLLPEGLRETEVVQYDCANPGGIERRVAVILERPLTVEVDGSSYTLLRTPGADRELVVGFLFTEGLIGKPDDDITLALARVNKALSTQKKLKEEIKDN